MCRDRVHQHTGTEGPQGLLSSAPGTSLPTALPTFLNRTHSADYIHSKEQTHESANGCGLGFHKHCPHLLNSPREGSPALLLVFSYMLLNNPPDTYFLFLRRRAFSKTKMLVLTGADLVTLGFHLLGFPGHGEGHGRELDLQSQS